VLLCAAGERWFLRLAGGMNVLFLPAINHHPPSDASGPFTYITKAVNALQTNMAESDGLTPTGVSER
jgi:hypothetical protein